MQVLHASQVISYSIISVNPEESKIIQGGFDKFRISPFKPMILYEIPTSAQHYEEYLELPNGKKLKDGEISTNGLSVKVEPISQTLSKWHVAISSYQTLPGKYKFVIEFMAANGTLHHDSHTFELLDFRNDTQHSTIPIKRDAYDNLRAYFLVGQMYQLLFIQNKLEKIVNAEFQVFIQLSHDQDCKYD